MKFCSIHGPTEDGDACTMPLAGGICNTVLTDQPDPRWAAEIERRRKTLEPYLPPNPAPYDPLGDGWVAPADFAPQFDSVRRDNARTIRTQGAFLAAFAQLGRIDLAAAAAGIDRTTHYVWLKNDKDYPALFEEAQELAAQLLMDEAVRRAVNGWEEPTTVAGEKVMVRKFSDRLLERLLEAHYPLKFRSNMAHRLVDKAGNDRKLLDYTELDALVKAADARDKEQA